MDEIKIMMESKTMKPIWSPRVKQIKLRKLYKLNSRGIYDDELIEDVGYTLVARCRSFIQAVEAARGKVICPNCGAEIFHKADKSEKLHCDCGWQLSWQEYFDTIRHQQLSGAEPVLEQFRNYITDFSIASSAREKMILIDQLVHGFHWDLKKNLPMRPVAINLIEGKLSDVVAFLNELSSSSTQNQYEEWQKNIEVNKEWYEKKNDQK